MTIAGWWESKFVRVKHPVKFIEDDQNNIISELIGRVYVDFVTFLQGGRNRDFFEVGAFPDPEPNQGPSFPGRTTATERSSRFRDLLPFSSSREHDLCRWA